MVVVEKNCTQQGANGKEMTKEKYKFWYCRDCLCSISVKE